MRSIDNAFEIITILSNEKEGLTLTEITERIDLPKSSVYRLLQSLKKNHIILQLDENKKYIIGYKLLSLSSNIANSKGIINSAKPYMNNLSKEIKKTISLNVMENEHILCIDFVESKDTPMFIIRKGYEMPIYPTSSGKVFLANMSEMEIKEIFNKNKIIKITKKTIDEKEDIYKDIEKVKNKGYAICDEELQIGVESIACPIFDYNGDVVASISVTTLKSDDFMNNKNISLISKCAKNITESLGGSYSYKV